MAVHIRTTFGSADILVQQLAKESQRYWIDCVATVEYGWPNKDQHRLPSRTAAWIRRRVYLNWKSSTRQPTFTIPTVYLVPGTATLFPNGLTISIVYERQVHRAVGLYLDLPSEPCQIAPVSMLTHQGKHWLLSLNLLDYVATAASEVGE